MIARHDNDRPEPTRDERVERYAEALGVQSFGMHPSEFDAIERVLAIADAEMAEKDATIATLRAEVAHWEHHAWEAGEGFKRAVEDAVRAGERRRAADAEVEDLHKRLADGERTFAECFARWKACEKGRDELKAALARVEALHVPCAEHPACADNDNFCHECGQDSPCTTARFLTGEGA